jgi:hypothetical protein
MLSALPLKADIACRRRQVCFAPNSEVVRFGVARLFTTLGFATVLISAGAKIEIAAPIYYDPDLICRKS